MLILKVDMLRFIPSFHQRFILGHNTIIIVKEVDVALIALPAVANTEDRRALDTTSRWI